jgi:hypothetical protein
MSIRKVLAVAIKSKKEAEGWRDTLSRSSMRVLFLISLSLSQRKPNTYKAGGLVYQIVVEHTEQGVRITWNKRVVVKLVYTQLSGISYC